MTIEIGTRVVLTESVDNFPTIIVARGETGTVTDNDAEATWVKLDVHHPELNEWDNRLQVWHWNDVELPLRVTTA